MASVAKTFSVPNGCVCAECRSYIPTGWEHSCGGGIAKTWLTKDPTNFTERTLAK